MSVTSGAYRHASCSCVLASHAQGALSLRRGTCYGRATMQLVPETPNGPAAPTTSTSRILAETLAALRSTDDEVALVHGRPRGPRWVRLSEALQDATTLRVWLTATGTAADDPERVATMFLASWLAGTLIEPVARSVIRHGRGWTLDPATLHVRPTDAGWFDGLAIGDGATVLVAADDPAAGQRGVRVLATTAEVRDATATQVATLGAEVLAGLRSVRPIGAPAFWGSLADAIAGSLVFDVEADGGDVEATFRDVRSFMDAVGRVVAIGRARPSSSPSRGAAASPTRSAAAPAASGIGPRSIRIPLARGTAARVRGEILRTSVPAGSDRARRQRPSRPQIPSPDRGVGRSRDSHGRSYARNCRTRGMAAMLGRRQCWTAGEADEADHAQGADRQTGVHVRIPDRWGCSRCGTRGGCLAPCRSPPRGPGARSGPSASQGWARSDADQASPRRRRRPPSRRVTGRARQLRRRQRRLRPASGRGRRRRRRQRLWQRGRR